MRTAFPVILILGPTAGGKTRLAIDLAKRLREASGTAPGGECICADSMQVYRGMDIGTAKPTRAEQAEVPHHLLDLVDPGDDGFTVDRWLERAEAAIAEIRGRGRYPIVVGGTNLYIQALLEGLFEGPPPDEDLRTRLEATPQDQLRTALERVDPTAAERIHRNDRKRTLRAIEVHTLTGIPMSEHQRQWFRLENRQRRDIWIIGLDYSVEAINHRINARVKAMMESGFVEEVRRLMTGRAGASAAVLAANPQAQASAPGFGRQAREALGYKQLIAALRGEISLDEAIEQVKIRTRRFAKQQRTWLRRFRNWPESFWLEATHSDAQLLADQCLTWIETRQSQGLSTADPRGTSPILPRTSC